MRAAKCCAGEAGRRLRHPRRQRQLQKKKIRSRRRRKFLATAKKIFGYDCAMCHGSNGDGKGELVESMKLKMKDWHEADALGGFLTERFSTSS